MSLLMWSRWRRSNTLARDRNKVIMFTSTATDDLTKTVHYGELAQLAAGIVEGQSRDLIETVAGQIADAVLAGFPVAAVEVTVHKPAAPIPLTFHDVSVTVSRARQSIAGPPQ
ncbi:MAG: dihydroneopterin aldolase [Nakamurella sp.]